MSQFNPTNRVMLAGDAPDLLAGGLLNALSRPIYYTLSWGVARSFVFTILTVGVLPMISLIGWLRLVIAQHREQLWHLAEWFRVQTVDPQAEALQKSSEGIQFSRALAGFAGVFVLIVMAAAGFHVYQQSFDLRSLYRFAFHLPQSPDQIVFTVAISAAAICHLAQILLHQGNIRTYVRLFNQVIGRAGLPPVSIPVYEIGLHPLWLMGGFALFLAGAIWALPVMLAMGAHRRYTMVTSVRLRAMLGERLRMLLLARRPAIPLPAPISIVRACIRPNCQASLPSIAAFCPRCGTKVARAMELVA